MANSRINEPKMVKCLYCTNDYECNEDCSQCPIPHEFREDQKESWYWAKSKAELDKIEKEIALRSRV